MTKAKKEHLMKNRKKAKARKVAVKARRVEVKAKKVVAKAKKEERRKRAMVLVLRQSILMCQIAMNLILMCLIVIMPIAEKVRAANSLAQPMKL